MKILKELLEKSFQNDKDIKISLKEDDKKIEFEINEKFYSRYIEIYIHNEFIIIQDNQYLEDEIIELLRINHILFEFDEMRMNLLILQFLKNFIDIIE